MSAPALDKRGEPLVCTPGDVFAGYEVTRFLLSGGGCQIAEATHRYVGRRVAIKVEKALVRSDQARRRRILAGARALALLEHPNVLRIRHSERMRASACSS